MFFFHFATGFVWNVRLNLYQRICLLRNQSRSIFEKNAVHTTCFDSVSCGHSDVGLTGDYGCVPLLGIPELLQLVLKHYP
jgi:hypothetical protein